MNSLPKTVTRQRCDCDLNPGTTVPESSTLTTRLPSHPHKSSNIQTKTVENDLNSVVVVFKIRQLAGMLCFIWVLNKKNA